MSCRSVPTGSVMTHFSRCVSAAMADPSSASIPSAPTIFGGVEQHRLIDQIGAEKRRGQRRAAFDHQPGDAPRGKSLSTALRSRRPPLSASATPRRPAAARLARRLAAPGPGNRPNRRFASAANQARTERQPQRAVEHDRAPANPWPCRAIGKSASDRPQAPCRCRS